MNRAKKSYRSMPLSFPKIVIMSFILLITFSTLVSAQNPQSAQWESAGGKMILSDTYELTEAWTTDSNNIDSGLYWQGGFYLPRDERNYVPYENAVKNDVAPEKGQITVKGPGVVVLFTKLHEGRGCPRVVMMNAETKATFLPARFTIYKSGSNWKESHEGWEFGAPTDHIDPLRLWRGKIKADETVSIDVSVIASSYNNMMNTGEFSFFPQSMDFEIWFFPFEGGKVIAPAPTPTPTPSPGPCRISLAPSPAHVMPGGSVEISGQALWADGQPITNALIDVSLGGLEGGGYVAPSRTDSQGHFRFTYAAPSDVSGVASVNLAVRVEGCPVSATVTVYFGPAPTPTETPWAGQVKGISDETRGELEKKSKTEERKDKLKDTDDPASKAKGLGQQATEKDIPSDKKDDFNDVSAGGSSLPKVTPGPLSKARVHNKVLDGLKEEKWKGDNPKLSKAISKKGVGWLKTIGKAVWTIAKKGANLPADVIGYVLEVVGMSSVQMTVNNHYDFYAEKRGDGDSHKVAMEKLRKMGNFDWKANTWRKVYNKEDYDKVFKDIYEKYGEGKK